MEIQMEAAILFLVLDAGLVGHGGSVKKIETTMSLGMVFNLSHYKESLPVCRTAHRKVGGSWEVMMCSSTWV